MTAKQALRELAATLPDDVKWEEVAFQLFLRQREQECDEAEKRGKVYTTEEVDAMVREWISQ